MKHTLILSIAIPIFIAIGAVAQAIALPIAPGATEQPSAVELARKKSDNNGKDWCTHTKCRHMWGIKKKRCMCRCEGGEWHGTKTSGQCFYY